MKNLLSILLVFAALFSSGQDKIVHRQIEPYTAFEIVGLNDFIQDSTDLSNYARLDIDNTFLGNQTVSKAIPDISLYSTTTGQPGGGTSVGSISNYGPDAAGTGNGLLSKTYTQLENYFIFNNIPIYTIAVKEAGTSTVTDRFKISYNGVASSLNLLTTSKFGFISC